VKRKKKRPPCFHESDHIVFYGEPFPCKKCGKWLVGSDQMKSFYASIFVDLFAARK